MSGNARLATAALLASLLSACQQSSTQNLTIPGLPGRLFVTKVINPGGLQANDVRVQYSNGDYETLIFEGAVRSRLRAFMASPETLVIESCGGEIKTVRDFNTLPLDDPRSVLVRTQVITSPGLTAGGAKLCEAES